MGQGDSNDTVTLRLPAKYIAWIFSVGLSLGGGAAVYLGPSVGGQIVKDLQLEIRENRDKVDKAVEGIARAETLGKTALDLGTQNSQQINYNRNFTIDRTFDRFTQEMHSDHTRKQADRDMLQDRRIVGIEKELESLEKKVDQAHKEK